MSSPITATYLISYSEHFTEDAYLILQVTAERNFGKTEFAPHESVLIDVITSHSISDTFSNFGTLVYNSTSEVEVTETLRWEDEDNKELRYKPKDGLFTHVWQGTREGAGAGSGVTLDGEQTLKTSGDVIGLMEVTYRVETLVYQLNNGHDSTMVWFQNSGGAETSIVIEFEEAAETVDVEVTLIVKDFCEGTIIPNASVWLDGAPKGPTDVDGELGLGTLQTGTPFTLRITADGYLPSDEDNLANDSFEIEL